MIPIRLPSSLYAEEALGDVGRALSVSVADAGNKADQTIDIMGF
jgi:hypothetical protein